MFVTEQIQKYIICITKQKERYSYCKLYRKVRLGHISLSLFYFNFFNFFIFTNNSKMGRYYITAAANRQSELKREGR